MKILGIIGMGEMGRQIHTETEVMQEERERKREGGKEIENEQKFQIYFLRNNSRDEGKERTVCMCQERY